MGLFNNNNNNNKEKKTVWYQGVIDKEKENIKKVFYFEDYNIENGSVFILTNDNKIIYGEKNKEGKTYKTFIISDIIKVDTFVKSKVIHQNQWWNIMNFTMEDIEKVEYIELNDFLEQNKNEYKKLKVIKCNIKITSIVGKRIIFIHISIIK